MLSNLKVESFSNKEQAKQNQQPLLEYVTASIIPNQSIVKPTDKPTIKQTDKPTDKLSVKPTDKLSVKPLEKSEDDSLSK